MDETVEVGTGAREARSPQELGRGWRDVLWRVRQELRRDRIGFVAAGVAFYAFFALFPALAAVVSLYGLIWDPHQVQGQIEALRDVLPGDVHRLVATELHRITGGPPTALGGGFVVSLALTLWSASRGVSGLVTAMNIAYDEEEKRGFVKRTSLILGFTLGAILCAVIALFLVAGVPALIDGLDLGTVGAIGAQVARWIVLAVLVLAVLGVMYGILPSRGPSKWRWVTVGSLVGSLLWILASVGFSLYVSWFGSYDKTFGSLGAVAILLMWFYIGAYVVLLGAELNADAEHRTKKASVHEPEPRGERGAYGADELGSPA